METVTNQTPRVQRAKWDLHRQNESPQRTHITDWWERNDTELESMSPLTYSSWWWVISIPQKVLFCDWQVETPGILARTSNALLLSTSYTYSTKLSTFSTFWKPSEETENSPHPRQKDYSATKVNLIQHLFWILVQQHSGPLVPTLFSAWTCSYLR